MKYHNITVYQHAGFLHRVFNSNVHDFGCSSITIEFKGPDDIYQNIKGLFEYQTTLTPTDNTLNIIEHILIPIKLISTTTLYKEYMHNDSKIFIQIKSMSCTPISIKTKEHSYCIELILTQRELELIKENILTQGIGYEIL